MVRVIATTTALPDRLVVLLPADPAGSGPAAYWWLVRGDAIAERGSGSEWQALALDRSIVQVGLAPIASLRLAFPEAPAGATARQRLAIARLAALDSSIADPATLHAAATSRPADGDAMLVAVAANDMMLGWLDWAERSGLTLDHIVPTAMALPLGDGWRRAGIGDDRLLGRAGCVVPDEPGLADVLLEGPAEPLDAAAVDSAIVRLAHDPRPDLRTGRFVRRRIIVDRSQWRTIGLLAASIVLVTTLIAVIGILKFERSAARLDRETLAIAQRAVGPTASLDTAESLLAGRAGAGGAGVSASFARLLFRLGSERELRLVNLAATSGTIRATLASPNPGAASRVLQALQRDGYRVSATPRQSTDGRTVIDLTIGHGA